MVAIPNVSDSDEVEVPAMTVAQQVADVVPSNLQVSAIVLCEFSDMLIYRL
jgi:hypothetical protein